ncbi:ATP-binding protein [Pseudovibrio denitrificans]|uniref:ATP-binding protein n=1 Tax=Pseudovibrio denitrificans TaxID=258256 RepID=UPI0039BFDD60
MNDTSRVLQFKPKARIIRTIGDQLISGPEAAIIELVKNSYDADATVVTIKFHPPLLRGEGRISISDNGHGMSIDDVREKWMEPATSFKANNDTSRSGKRRMMGSKGIGRFASAKLGRVMSLMSTADVEGERKTVLIPELDWSVFNDECYLSDIKINFLEQVGEDQTGTVIEVRELNENWTKDRVEQLYLELRRLISPINYNFENEEDMKMYFDLSLCSEENCGFNPDDIIERQGDFRVKPIPVLSACDYELKGRIDEKGVFSGNFTIRRANLPSEKVELTLGTFDAQDSPGEIEVYLYVFDREANTLKRNLSSAGLGELSAREAREIVDQISGVSIYREDFRIRPYGDAKNDWLTLDSRRVQDPSLRIGHNQVSGYLAISHEGESNLVERSSREGFEENEAFDVLRKMVLKLFANLIEPKRQIFREKTGISRRREATFDEVKELAELKKIRSLLNKFPARERAEAEAVINKQSKILQNRVEQIQERQRILEAKVSLGAIVGEVLHEGGPHSNFVFLSSEKLIGLLPSVKSNNAGLRDSALSTFEERLPLVRGSSEVLVTLFQSLKPLAGGARGKPKYFSPVNVIHKVKNIFKEEGVEFETIRECSSPEFLGYESDLMTALVNLTSNSVYWLQEHNIENAQVEFRVLDYDDKLASIEVVDNGLGIPEEFVEKIFDVGFSLKENGTGLGLNIAREALARSGGSLFYYPEFTGGSKFEIRFPIGL